MVRVSSAPKSLIKFLTADLWNQISEFGIFLFSVGLSDDPELIHSHSMQFGPKYKLWNGVGSIFAPFFAPRQMCAHEESIPFIITDF